MIAIMGAGLCSIVILLSVLLICGLPLGELTMGGQYKVYTGKLRILLLVQLIIQVFFVITVLQAGGLMPLWFPYKRTKIVCIIMAVYLSVNVAMNFISKSPKEKYIMTPLSFLTAVCFWLTALKM